MSSAFPGLLSRHCDTSPSPQKRKKKRKRKMKNLIQLDKAYLYISCLIYCSRSLLSISSCIFLFSIFVFHLSCCHCFLNCLVFNKCLYPNILELFFFFFKVFCYQLVLSCYCSSNNFHMLWICFLVS